MNDRPTHKKLTVYNKPFFVNELLNNIQPETITPEMFSGMVQESSLYDLSTILTAMTRQIDYSGMVPNFAGVFNDPQDVLETVTTLGCNQLIKIARLEPHLQNEVFDTLKGQPNTTIRALLVLNDLQKDVIDQLNRYRRGSTLAQAFRWATENALKGLYKDQKKLFSALFEEVIPFNARWVEYTGEPRISYPHRVVQGHVVEVWQFFFMPAMDDIRLPEPYERLWVGEVLRAITPKAYQRACVDDTFYDPQTPTGFIGLLGKVGGAMPRLIASQVSKNQQFRQQVMEEEEIASALYELFSR